jgi:hypothetical protein
MIARRSQAPSIFFTLFFIDEDMPDSTVFKPATFNLQPATLDEAAECAGSSHK